MMNLSRRAVLQSAGGAAAVSALAAPVAAEAVCQQDLTAQFERQVLELKRTILQMTDGEDYSLLITDFRNCIAAPNTQCMTNLTAHAGEDVRHIYRS